MNNKLSAKEFRIKIKEHLFRGLNKKERQKKNIVCLRSKLHEWNKTVVLFGLYQNVCV